MRTYLIQSWNNAAEYSGEQVGQRNKASQGIYLPNGMANTALFADEEPKKAKPKVDMSIPLEIRQLDKLDSDILTNEKLYRSGERSEEMYRGIKKILDSKHERLVKKLDRMGFFDENETQEGETSWQRMEKPSLPYVFDSKINEKLFLTYVYIVRQTFKIIRNFVRGF